MKRFYVTMTWDDFPEGGSYGTVVEAETPDEAEGACRQEMAESYAEHDDEHNAAYYLETYGDDWHLIDCFDLDEFIARHKRPASPDNGVQNAAAIRALAHKRWDNDECTVTSDAVLDQAEEDGAVWVTCQRLLTADVLKDNGLLIDPYEVAARAAGWERGGDFGGFWYDDSEYGHWKAAASDNDAFTFATAEEVCEHLGLEVEETGWQPAPVTTPDPGKPAEQRQEV